MTEYVLRSARYLAHDCLSQVLREGDRAVDATMGNGHDTQFLAELVGETGHVDAFDIQAQAVENTKKRLAEAQLEPRVTLYHAGHETMAQHVTAPVRAVMFNLGWLPGGDKQVTTLWDTTRVAIHAALSLLEEMGVCVICAYPGHAEGSHERSELEQMLSLLRPQEYNCLHQKFLNAGDGSPECFIIQKQACAKTE